jgi:hypothetical protein
MPGSCACAVLHIPAAGAVNNVADKKSIGRKIIKDEAFNEKICVISAFVCLSGKPFIRG